MTTAMWGERKPTPELTKTERQIRSAIRRNSVVRRRYDEDLMMFKYMLNVGYEGPQLPSVSDMQGWPGLLAAEFITRRVECINNSPNHRQAEETKDIKPQLLQR